MKIDLRSGAPRLIAASKLGGEPPARVHVFPDGLYRTTKGDFWVGAAERKQIIATWKDYGNALAWDWDHHGYYAALEGTLGAGRIPTAAYYTNLIDSGSCDGRACIRDEATQTCTVHGLWSDVAWTESGAASVRKGDELYDSPLFLPETKRKDNKPRRILELWGCTLTAAPASKSRIPIFRQQHIAAQRAVAASRHTNNASMEGSTMLVVIDNLRWFFDLSLTTTKRQLRTILQATHDAVEDNDELAFAVQVAAAKRADGTTPATLGEMLEAEMASATDEDTAVVVASRAVLDALGISDAEPTEAQVVGRAIEIATSRTPDEDVAKLRADLEAARATITQLQATDEESRIQAHIATSGRITPALEPKFRELATKHGFEFAVEASSFWPKALPPRPDESLETAPPSSPADRQTTTRSVVSGRQVAVSAAGAAAKEEVEKIMREEKVDYVTASRLRRERRVAAQQ